MDYRIRRLWVKEEPRDREAWENLLHLAGIRSEEHVEYTVGVYDGEVLVATGSRHQNVLKCIAVCTDYTGGSVVSTLVSHLMAEIFSAGYHSCYVYTKAESVQSFQHLGFRKIEQVEDRLVFMEKALFGFEDFLARLRKKRVAGKRIAGIVMNANPFTKGHQYLIETAAKENDVLHVFVLSEEMSDFPAEVRKRLVQQGTAHLKNVHIHETGDYMVSAKTFPSYFLKEDADVTEIQASLDARIFKEHIAPALGITRRYVGEEPLSFATSIYNRMLKTVFADDLTLIILQRKEAEGEVISASKVRKRIREHRAADLKDLVPSMTYDFLQSPLGREIQEQIQNKE